MVAPVKIQLESIDNGYLPSESFERTIKIWDLINCKLKCTFDKLFVSKTRRTDPIKSLKSIGDGRLARTYDGAIKIWDITNG